VGTVAILIGGMIATFTSLVAVFGMGVDWSTGFIIYFATGLTTAMIILIIGIFARKSQKETCIAENQKLTV
jgi:hypothetical protein